MRLEAVCVCVGFDDMLAETLLGILAAVDSLVIVTSPTDKATIRLCRQHAVRAVLTDAFYEHGSRFSLGRGINAGLKVCARDDWVLVVDADIVLPRHTRGALDFAELDPKKLYGIDRVRCVGRRAWDAVRHEQQYRTPRVVAPPFRLEDRVAMPGFGGWMPCGFFGLWNPAVSGIHDYAVAHQGTAEQSDMEQASRWKREDRVLLPEIIGVHLVTSTDIGADWCGRATARF